jgi:hypothetical protein
MGRCIIKGQIFKIPGTGANRGDEDMIFKLLTWRQSNWQFQSIDRQFDALRRPNMRVWHGRTTYMST